MQFGGSSRFGGGGQFGGCERRSLAYYRALKAMRPPGAFSDDDGAHCNKALMADAIGIGDHGQVWIDRLAEEMFPGSAEESLGEWETLLRVVPPAGETIAARRAAIVAAWRGGVGSTVPELRKVLAPLLNPSTAFRDAFDADSVSWRWLQEARAGAISQALGQLLMGIGESAADWTGGAIGCPTVRVPLVDRDDAVTLSAELASGGGVRAGGGLALWQSATDAYLFYRYYDGDETWLQVDVIVGGALERPLHRELSPDVPFWLQIEKTADAVTFRAGATLATLATVHTMAPRTIRPRDACLFLRNTASAPAVASVAFGEVRVSHGKAENNVEVIEATPAVVPESSSAHVFSAFIHREPVDQGDYSVVDAQRIADRLKLGHCLVLVGESDCFRADDEHSLVGRDVLGG